MMVKAAMFQAIIAGMEAMGIDTSWMTMGTRASGGGVQTGIPVVVGENGPEIFVPPGAGNIVSNDKVGGVGGMRDVNLTLVINKDGSQEMQGDTETFGRNLLETVRAVVTSEINRNMRIGGTFNPIAARR